MTHATRTTIHVPTTQGDVSITKVDEKTCTFATTKLSHMEKKVVTAILDKFLVPRSYNKTKLEDQTFTLPEKIESVHKVLMKQLKKDKTTITAVKLADGSITEVLNPDKVLPPGDSVTVEKPARGCPPRPEMPPREVRATRVLEMFLNPVQLADFRERGAVCVVGCATGHRYSVCHPLAAARLQSPHCGHLVVDLDDDYRYCTYQMNLPPAEELLAHVLMLELREREWTGLPG